MIKVDIKLTCKSFSPKENYRTYDSESHSFRTMPEVLAYLKDRYGKCRRDPIFVDVGTETFRCGWVYGFRAPDVYNRDGTVDRWLQEDWVNLSRVEPILGSVDKPYPPKEEV